MTLILTWNRDEPDTWPDYPTAVDRCRSHGEYWTEAWSVGRRINIPEGEEFLLLCQGRSQSRGLIARGITTSTPYLDVHYRKAHETIHYVDVMFTQMLPLGELVPLEDLLISVPGIPWNGGIRGSGYSVPGRSERPLIQAWETTYLQSLVH